MGYKVIFVSDWLSPFSIVLFLADKWVSGQVTLILKKIHDS